MIKIGTEIDLVKSHLTFSGKLLKKRSFRIGTETLSITMWTV